MLIHAQLISKEDVYLITGKVTKFDMERSKLLLLLDNLYYEDLKMKGYELYFVKDLISNYFIYERISLWYNKETKDFKHIENKKRFNGEIQLKTLESGEDTFDSDLCSFEKMILGDCYIDKDGKYLEQYPEGIGRFHLSLSRCSISKEYFEENKNKAGFIDYVTKERG